MILSFKTNIDKKPTNFVEKIWEGFLQRGIQFKASEMKIGMTALPEDYKIKTFIPKLHTIRIDEKDRWRPGVIIDFFINPRTKKMFRFAPRVPVVSTQKLFLTYFPVSDRIVAQIDGKRLKADKLIVLSQNDGFDNYEDFKNYFKPFISSGNPTPFKLIHWTDLQY